MLTLDLSAFLKNKLGGLCPDLAPDSGFAIAYSGGGDSTALMHALKDHPASQIVLIVDHGLRKDSRAEALQASDYAGSLGLQARVLSWKAPRGLSTGIQAKARRARYNLLGQACRDLGIAYLLTGHTQDDQAETALMRYERQTDWRGAALMAETSRQSLWPELCGVTLVRPLLGISRESLRAYNRTHKCQWVDDPSNDNPAFSRIAARHYLQGNPWLKTALLEPVSDLQDGIRREKAMMAEWTAQHLTHHNAGYVSFAKIPPTQLLYRLIHCVSGSDNHIPREKLKTLKAQMQKSDFAGATLGGCKIERKEDRFIIARNMRFSSKRVSTRHTGQLISDPFSLCSMGQGERWIWDNRYGVKAKGRDWQTIAYCALPFNATAISQKTSFKLEQERITEQAKLWPLCARQSLPVHYNLGSGEMALGEVSRPDFVVKCLLSQRLTDFLLA